METFIEKRDALITRVENMIKDFDTEREYTESLGGRIYSSAIEYRYHLTRILEEAETVENSQDICDIHDRLNEM